MSLLDDTTYFNKTQYNFTDIKWFTYQTLIFTAKSVSQWEQENRKCSSLNIFPVYKILFCLFLYGCETWSRTL